MTTATEFLSTTLYTRLGAREGIMRLIRPFYGSLQVHPLLGPIFNRHVGNWSSHLERVVDFWAGMTDGPEPYSGGMDRHFFMALGPEHFRTWLEIWNRNARMILPPQEAHEMIHLAHGISTDLEQMTGRPHSHAFAHAKAS